MDALGLEGIVVAETRLSRIDGARGELVVAGHHLHDLVEGFGVSSLCALLWGGDADARRAELGLGRVRAAERLGGLGAALAAPDGMSALAAAMSLLPPTSTHAEITAACAVFAAAWQRREAGLEPIAPDPTLAHGRDCLRLIRGACSEEEARAMTAYLVTVADHGVNASTFAARVVTSTGADRVAAVCAAINTLKGPLHGGAPGPVLDMLDGAGAHADGPDGWIADELRAGRRIMGMGHRVYRARDPRAAVLEGAAERLQRAGGQTRLAAARALEAAAQEKLAARHPTRPLRANVELFTAVLLDALGLDRRGFSPTFAVGRVVGWLAHADEQERAARLIRPASRYIGPEPGEPARPRR